MILTYHEYRGYVFTLECQPEDPAYIVSFLDFRNIISSGQTLPGAFSNVCKALGLHHEIRTIAM